VRRHDQRLLARVFEKRRSLTEIAAEQRLTRQAISYRFRCALKKQLLVSEQEADHAILLIDGVWFRFKRRPWVLYLMALWPVNADKARFLTPVLLRGSESKTSWQRALATIPDARRDQVLALVCDNFVGSRQIAQENNWIHQLCHFHLIAQLRRRLGYNVAKTPARLLRQSAYRMVRRVLDTPDDAEAGELVATLRTMAREGLGGRRYTNIVRSFLRHFESYRAYYRHPALRLPKTTGTAESMGRIVRDLERRARGFSSARAAELWLTNYVTRRPEVTCLPGKLSTN